jgi:hypothetical protein
MRLVLAYFATDYLYWPLNTKYQCETGSKRTCWSRLGMSTEVKAWDVLCSHINVEDPNTLSSSITLRSEGKWVAGTWARRCQSQGLSKRENEDCIAGPSGERISGNESLTKLHICSSTITILHINFQSINQSLFTCSSDNLKPVAKDR